jgi:hypothetical protein
MELWLKMLMKPILIAFLLSSLSGLRFGASPATQCPALTFEGVSQSTWSCVKAKFAEKGFTVADGVSGEITNGEIRGDFDFRAAQKKLLITVKSDVMCSTVSKAITEAVDICMDFQEVRQLQRGATERWRIDAPNVQQAETPYPQIKFRRGDTVTVSAGGCVQHGGPGKTWALYVDPQKPGAGNSPYFYGQIRLPGMFAMQKIKDVIKSSYAVPADAFGDMFLKLGFTDFRYTDNGYWGRQGDDGFNDQCKGVPNAWVEIAIAH